VKRSRAKPHAESRSAAMAKCPDNTGAGCGRLLIGVAQPAHQSSLHMLLFASRALRAKQRKRNGAFVLAQGPCNKGMQYATTMHFLRALVILAGINLADQRVALTIGIDENDGKIVCRSADYLPCDLTDIL
jgi:hypothetical protein